MARHAASRAVPCAALWIAALALPGTAAATLLVHEPFGYTAGTVLDGAPATGSNLTGSWLALGPNPAQKLVASSPGLDYGSLVGAPPASGNRAEDADGVTAAGGTVAVDQDVLVPAGATLYWSVLLQLDDSTTATASRT